MNEIIDLQEMADDRDAGFRPDATESAAPALEPPEGAVDAVGRVEAPEPAGDLETSTGVGDERATSVTDGEGPAVATMLVMAGLVLALGGGALMVLAWLSRRASDPLVR